MMCPICAKCGVNDAAILGATVASFILGALWYSPVMFLKPWMAAMGKKPEDCKGKSCTKPMVFCFITTLLTAFSLAVVLRAAGVHDGKVGALAALFICAGFILTSDFINFMFTEGKSTVFWIGTGHKVCQFLLMGAILGHWAKC